MTRASRETITTGDPEMKLAVKPFVDTRGLTNIVQIGGKWDKADPTYIAKRALFYEIHT